ncbi:MAG: DUF1223 domain-containing protein [Myxococcota bacterium]
MGAATAGCSRESAASDEPRAALAAKVGARTVLVELFTSEGCSSCPPADALVHRLLNEPQDIAVVAFHVDYWNYLGWSDRFSAERWSDRQRDYARAMSTSRVYTPQLLFDGRDHHVGAQYRKATAAIEHAAETPASHDLEVVVRRQGARARATVEVADRGTAKAGAKVMVALVADAAQTEVRRGENAGRDLVHRSVALELREACTVGVGESVTCDVDLDLGPYAGQALGVVAFVQHPKTMVVSAASSTALDR